MRPHLLSCPSQKQAIARAARASGAASAARAWERRRPALRIVNYHSVPSRFERQFAAQIAMLRRTWVFASPADLSSLLAGAERPTLLFCFDDGLSSTVRRAAEILEDAGARAIFAVPAAWPDVAPAEREAWFQRHVYPVPTELHASAGDVDAPSWEELRGLVARGHEIWSHGFDHVRLRRDTPSDVLERELVGSKRILEDRLGSAVRGYCPPVAYDVPPDALKLLGKTYDYAFGGPPAPVPNGADPLRLPRSNIEASWPQSAIEFQLSSLGDVMTRVLQRVRP